jgi:3-methyl-2-oxobutanoate hydroxymethyltransferase
MQWLARLGTGSVSNRLTLVLSSVVLVVLTTGTVLRNEIWRDEVRLFSDVVAKSPRKPRPYNLLIKALMNRGEEEEAIRIGFKALELGASSVYCSASPWIIEAMAREGIPVVGHLGMVPRHATWTNFRAIGKTAVEARRLYEQLKLLENAGAYAAELELVPHQLASYFCKKTSLLLMSLGSGSGCDTQFLFSDDILGDYDERIPRHAKAYRNFLKEHQRLQDERIAAFRAYAEDVIKGRFPEAGHLVAMDEALFNEAVNAIEGLG